MLIYAYKNRGVSKLITIKDGNGNPIVPGNNDQIRCRIGCEGDLDGDPLLTVSSVASTANGSSFSKNTPISGKQLLRLDASDLAFTPGTYTAAFDLFDNADAAEWKNVDRQVFVLE